MTETRSGPVVPYTTGDVKVGVADGVVTITIDRPSKKKALTQEMYGRMADALLEADDDPEVRAVVLTGTDDVFTAGNDLTDFASGGDLGQSGRFLVAISSVHVPVVAAVNGLAIGVGLTLLLHCDVVVVDPGARISAPFVELGLVPEAASTLLLPRVVGERRAAELFLTGRRLTGAEAVEWGLANAAASPALTRALELADAVAARPRGAARATKALLRSEDRTVAGRMGEEAVRFVEALQGPEFAAVMAARARGR
jgi:enoyl-CoA hydratase/carnithine racemase